MAFLPLAKTQPLCFWQFGFITLQLSFLRHLIKIQLFFTLFAKNIAVVFLLMVKMAAPQPVIFQFWDNFLLQMLNIFFWG